MLTIQFIFNRTWSVTIRNGSFVSRIDGHPTRDEAERSAWDRIGEMRGSHAVTELPDILDCMPDDAMPVDTCSVRDCTG